MNIYTTKTYIKTTSIVQLKTRILLLLSFRTDFSDIHISATGDVNVLMHIKHKKDQEHKTNILKAFVSLYFPFIFLLENNKGIKFSSKFNKF